MPGGPAKPSRFDISKPWLLLAIILGGAGAGITGIAFLPSMREQTIAHTAFLPMGLLLLATGTVPLIIGVIRLLEQPPLAINHCGRCKFYVANTANYASGLCGYGRAHITLRESTCEHFNYSERAMVRDRFAEATQVMNGIPQE